MYNTINNMRMPFSHKIIPLAYDQSLSYYEQLLAITEYVNNLTVVIEEEYNKIITDVNTNVTTMLSVLKEEMDRTIANIYRELTDSIISNYNTLDIKFTTLQDNVEDEILDISTELVRLNTSITKLYTDWNLYLVACDSKIDSKLDVAVKELDKVIKDSLAFASGEYIIVWNPVKQKNTKLNTCIKDLFSAFNYCAITAQEYSNLNLTAEDYSNLGITALEYDTTARFIFFKELYLKDFINNINTTLENIVKEINNIKNSLNMRNPFTGEIVNFKVVITELVNLHKVDAINAEEYSNLELDAEGYNSYNINAYDYDFNAKQIIVWE